MQPKATERFTLTLESIPGYRQPVDVRLRHLLKMALRTCGLRAVAINPEINPESNEQRPT